MRGGLVGMGKDLVWMDAMVSTSARPTLFIICIFIFFLFDIISNLLTLWILHLLYIKLMSYTIVKNNSLNHERQ